MRSITALITSTFLLASCATTPAVPPVNEDMGQALVGQAKEYIPGGCVNADQPAATTLVTTLNAVCQGIDILGKLSLNPSPYDEFAYSEDNDFDRKLHKSLKYKHPTVTVLMTDVNITRKVMEAELLTPESPRITAWLANLENRGGEIISCAEKQPEFLLNWIFGSLLKIADDWVTYRPLNNYAGAAIVYELRSGKWNAREVIFTRDAPTCPDGTELLATPA